MEYKLVTADSTSYLQQLVNSYIKDGFKPKGDVQIIIDSQYNRHSGIGNFVIQNDGDKLGVIIDVYEKYGKEEHIDGITLWFDDFIV